MTINAFLVPTTECVKCKKLHPSWWIIDGVCGGCALTEEIYKAIEKDKERRNESSNS